MFSLCNDCSFETIHARGSRWVEMLAICMVCFTRSHVTRSEVSGNEPKYSASPRQLTAQIKAFPKQLFSDEVVDTAFFIRVPVEISSKGILHI